MKRTLFTLALLTAASQAPASSVYRCVVDGETIFSQQPCSAQAEEVQINFIRANEEEARRRGEAAEFDRSTAEGLERQRRIREIQARIDTENRAINQLQRDRDRELANIRRRQANTNDNLAGATLRHSLSEEMNGVNQRYDSQIAQRQTTIDRLQAEITRITAQ